MIGYRVTDNLTNYLDELSSKVIDRSYREKFLNDMARELVSFADETIPRWNPNIRYSGLNEGFWQYSHKENKSTVKVTYTGFTGEGMGEPDDIQVWWEFGKYHRGGYNDILGRDYAYYLEFGQDKFAPNSKVKAPDRTPSLYLTTAVIDMEDMIDLYAEEFMNLILNK